MPVFSQTLIDTTPTDDACPRWEQALGWVRAAIVIWLLLVGLWSGPAYGATLAYPNGMPAVEIVLLVVLILLARRGRVSSVWSYPFTWPCLALLGLCALTTGVRVFVRGVPFDVLRLWQNGEPMLRGLLLYLAIAGQPRLARLAWGSMLVGITLSSAATVVQYLTGVVRWYRNLDVGYAGGIHPARVDILSDRFGRPLSRAQGLTSYINLTAAISAAALPYWLLPPLLRVPLTRPVRVLLLLGGVLTAAALWFTNSRGPALAVAVVAVGFLWRLRQRWGIGVLIGLLCFVLGISPAIPLWAVGIAVVAVALAGGYYRPARWALFSVTLGLGLAIGIRVVVVNIMHYPSAARVQQGVDDPERSNIYRDALAAIRIAPWVGIGDAAMSEREQQLAARHLIDFLPRTQRNAHCQYLQWIAAEGAPVALGFILLTLGVVGWCWRRAEIWRSPFARVLALAGAAGLTIFLFTNLADAFFWRIEGAGFFWSVFAVTAAVGETEEANSAATDPSVGNHPL